MNAKAKKQVLETITTASKNTFTLERWVYSDNRKNYPHYDVVLKIHHFRKHESDKVLENFGTNEKQAHAYWKNKVVKTFGDDKKKEVN